MDPVATTVGQEAIGLAQQVEHLGIVGILALVAFWLGYLYMRERRENAKLHDTILTNSKEMTSCIVGVQAVITSHTQVMTTVAEYLHDLNDLAKE